MKIDLTSMFFNSKIEGQTATAAWGTAVSKQTNPCFIYEDVEFSNIFSGMLYCSKTDKEHLDIKGMSSSRELVMFSVFDKIFVNGLEVKDSSFILLLVKEHSASHDGRMLLSYPMYAKYTLPDNIVISNEQTKNRIAEVIGCSTNGCWFVSEISIANQDTLLINAHIVDKDNPKIYKGTSKQRSAEWQKIVSESSNISKEEVIKSLSKPSRLQLPLQQIYYGAPGTGKSHTVNEITSALPKENVFRTTFHPDSDYSTFVGCYKPTMKSIVKTVIIGQDEKEVKPLAGGTNSVDQIAYAFVPQVFAKAYVRAYQTEESVFLVIEEINRGNCAQIFGDIFQLLDRDDCGDSKYAVKPDSDLENYLVQTIGDKYDPEEGIRLPSNLHIWATMNTSDQSLFPIDSAFKRRWDWQYIPIENHSEKNWKIKVGVEEYDWWEFLEAMNKRIYKATDSEDKQMGYFFVRLKNGETIISEDMIVNKVLFYLFNDVFKDYDSEDLFKVDKKVMCFSDYTKKNDRTMLLMSLMKSLNLETENEKRGNNAVNATPIQATLDL